MKRRQPAEADRTIHGGLTFSGSWNEHGDRETPLMNVVSELRHARQTTTMSPQEAAERIPVKLCMAFPNLDQWHDSREWCECKTSTSAESLVVYAIRHKSGEVSAYPESSGEPSLDFGGISAGVMELLSRGARPMQVAEFLASRLYLPELTDAQKQQVRDAMNDWASRDPQPSFASSDRFV